MPITGTALLVAIGVAVSVWGGGKIAHGVKKVTHALAHHEKKPAAPRNQP
jgi:hypothetical protein